MNDSPDTNDNNKFLALVQSTGSNSLPKLLVSQVEMVEEEGRRTAGEEAWEW